MYTNTPSNAIIKAVSNISYRPQLETADTGLYFCSSVNVVIGKLGKLVHKQSCSRYLYFVFIDYNIVIVQVRYITFETKEVSRIGYNMLLFPHSYSGEDHGDIHLGFHLSIHTGKETRYFQCGPFLFCFNCSASDT